MYQITYYPTSSDARKLKELSINSTISLTNMEPGTEYNFEIETISNGIHSDPMLSTVITTPDEIEDLKIVDKDFTSASFAWEHNSLNNTRNADGLVNEDDASDGKCDATLLLYLYLVVCFQYISIKSGGFVEVSLTRR